MKEYWGLVPRPAGHLSHLSGVDPVIAGAIERGDEMSRKLVASRDELFGPMRKLAAGGDDALRIGVLQALVEVLADFNSTRGRQHRPGMPLYHPLWEIMLLGGTHGMVASALGVETAILQEREGAAP
jgi:hypothetical protein